MPMTPVEGRCNITGVFGWEQPSADRKGDVADGGSVAEPRPSRWQRVTRVLSGAVRSATRRHTLAAVAPYDAASGALLPVRVVRRR